MMMQAATRHFERAGYSPHDAQLKATGVIAEAQADPTFAKLIANAYDQQQLLANDLTGAQIQVGAMEGRRDQAGSHVIQTERGNVATEQAWRTGSNHGQRQAASQLGLGVAETARRVGFINALSGEARSTAITQLAHSTGRSEAQVLHALESYNAAVQVGTADGASAEAAREGTSVYGRTRETAQFDFAERAGKLDAQREVGLDGTRNSARIGEQRREADNEGFAQGAHAAGASVREAARLDSFISTLSQTVGNREDMDEGGAAGIGDRARNRRLTAIVDNERLTRMQGLLAANGIRLTRRQIAMGENGDFSMNLTPQAAADFWKAGLINESQLGAIANGGTARLSLAGNDMLVSSATSFTQSARSDTSTRFEAGKQAGPDTIEHFMGGGPEGKEMLADWLRGGFEMDRKGEWRLKPQVADTLQRDLQAVMLQTGWQRSLTRSADKSTTISTSWGASIGGSASSHEASNDGSGHDAKRPTQRQSSSGRSSLQLGADGRESNGTGIVAAGTLDIVNYDVRSTIANAEKAAASGTKPERVFTEALAEGMLGRDGLRNKYLGDAASGRSVFDPTTPFGTLEQGSVLVSGRLSTDLDQGLGDDDPTYRRRRD